MEVKCEWTLDKKDLKISTKRKKIKSFIFSKKSILGGNCNAS